MAKNRCCSPLTARRLADRELGFTVALELAGNPSTPEDLVWRLIREKRDRDIQWRLGARTDLVLAMQKELLKTDGCRMLANNPVAAPEVVMEIIQEGDDVLRTAVAQRKPVEPEAARELSEDSAAMVRRALAANPSCPPAILARLASDKEAVVREAVAGNPNTEVTVLKRLLADLDCRASLAGNPRTPPEELLEMACDWRGEVRMRVVWNPSVQPETVRQLQQDPVPAIRLQAQLPERQMELQQPVEMAL